MQLLFKFLQFLAGFIKPQKNVQVTIQSQVESDDSIAELFKGCQVRFRYLCIDVLSFFKNPRQGSLKLVILLANQLQSVA